MKKRRNLKVYKKTISLFLSLFMVIQIFAFKVPFLSTAYAANAGQLNQYDWQNPYVQNFDDGNIGGWQAAVGTASTLTVENNQMKVVRGKDNNLIVVDQNSPQLADGDYEFQFTLKEGDSRVGAIFRYTSSSSWAFAGYNNNDGTWLIECPGNWKDGIKGPKLVPDKQYTMKVRFIGNKVTLWLDGQQVFDESVSLTGFPTGAGKIGVRTWYDNKTLLFDNFKYSTPAPAEQPGIRLITDTDIIASNAMNVTIDKQFPNVVKYEKNSAVMYGTNSSMDVVKINGKEYKPQVQYTNNNNSAEYTLVFNEINVAIKAKLQVNENILSMDITDIKETGDTKVNSIEIPNHNLLSVRSTQNGAAFAGSRMYNAVSGSGDVFLPVTGTPATDAAAINYIYGILNTSELSGAIWTNSLPDYSSDNDNERIRKQTVKQQGYYQTGIWSSSWLYRAEGMSTTEALPSVKVAITGDANEDSIVDWQDGAIAFRSIMNNPVGADRVPDLVVMRIPFNFASQATNPFLKTLDETKRVYLATDGLGQWVELKGYQGEGHDQAHLDYGGHIGVRQGGAADMNTLVDEGHKYNGYFGVHISATGANPEANAFSDTIINPNSLGWDWLDESYDFDKPTMRKEASTDARLNRLKLLKNEVPNLDFIYADAFYEKGFNGRRLAKEVNSQGWAMTTEFPDVLEYDSTWNHWAVDYSYGGQSMKGYNSQIARFIRNHQKDTWIARNPLLGGAEMCDFEGWQGRVDFNDMINMTFQTNLPTKYMQHFKIIKWTTDTINFENNVSVSNATGKRIITKDSREVLRGDSYLLPWNPKEETKLYHWNSNGGETTWTLPASWNGLKDVKLYKLSDQGKTLVDTLQVSNDKVTISAEANTPYVVFKGEAAANPDVKWGEGTLVKDPGFNSATLKDWKVTGEGASVERSTLGQYELKVRNSNGTTVSQQINGLSEGTYSASVSVEADGKRRATIGVKDYSGAEVTNYTDSSIAKNYILADSKHDTNMQRMRVLFDLPAGQTQATLYLKVDGGTDTVTFDDIRVVKTKRTPNPTGAYFAEDFENVDQGIYPFVKGPAGGVNDPRTHLSELHAPYTQKGWNGKAVDDVIDGHWSLKAHKESTGLLYQTIPQTIRFIPGKYYKVTFKYENQTAGSYGFVIGDGNEEISTKKFIAADVPTTFSKAFEASESGESWIGIKKITGTDSDFILDDLVVEEIDSLPPVEDEDIIPVDLSIVPHSGMTVTATSEETENGDLATNAIDGDEGTLWHTKWDKSDPLPQSLMLDLGGRFDINKVEVTPRQSQDNGKITKYELYASSNGKDYTKIASGSWDRTSDVKVITFDKIAATHIKLTALEGVNGWASLAEINVFREPVTIISAEPVQVETVAGKAPRLPQNVTAQLSDGDKASLPVKWNAIDKELYSKEGTFTVEGSVNKTETKVTATITVKPLPVSIISIIPINVTTKVGTAPVLPAKVTAAYSDKSTKDVDVNWDNIDTSKYAKIGTFTVNGTVNGTTIKAIANVTVNKATPSVTTWPTAADIIYGQTLEASKLSGGAASVEGTFAFSAPNTVPNVGSQSFDVIFTPTDSTNYKTVYGKISVTAVYKYSGVLQPINADGTSVFNAGSTIPVKFTLKDYSGSYVSTANATLSYAKLTNNGFGTDVKAISTSAAANGNAFRYDSTSSQYIFHMSTKSFTAGTYRLTITLDDGKSYSVQFNLK
ncbi:endo-alpha-N-acetylgalactosaminidase family protein [Neobacillus drentensis]|uniref:endo-alpha-N-acetylgalactosaminidase family protein n=1 Tax=Neobacillus drentensis TaxID=220684 RepID=UPI0030025645